MIRLFAFIATLLASSALSSGVGAQCSPQHDATNHEAAATIRDQWVPKSQRALGDLRALVVTNDMKAVGRALEPYAGPLPNVPIFRCSSPSFSNVVAAYNEYVEVENAVVRERIRLYSVVISNAEAALGVLSGATDRLVIAVQSNTGVQAARGAFDAATLNVRAFVLHDHHTPGLFRFEASDFWARADRTIARGNAAYSTPEQVVSEFSETISVETANVIANVEVRHLSFGPGFCSVDTRSSLGAHITTNAPPGVWSGWQVIEPHAGKITVTLSTSVNCDGDVRSQVRYLK